MPYLNISPEDESQSVYRILPVDRFISDLRTGQNVLVRPRLWDDPFENVMMSAVGMLPDGREVAFGFRDDYFGQCWSLHKETDLMWRGYSPKGDGVKIRCTVRKLHDSLYSCLGDFADISCFVGRVEYLKRAALKNTLGAGLTLDRTNRFAAATLLIKRFGFRSEREVRLIAYRHDAPAAEDLYRYSVGWDYLLEEVVLHPAMPASTAKKLRRDIRDAGFNGRTIQSGLYRKPKRSLRIPVKF